MTTELPKREPSPPKKGNQQYRPQAWRVASNLWVSFQYAWQGIAYSFTTQRNFRIHVTVALSILSLALVLRVSLVELAIMTVMIAMVLVLELLNTAMESAVDLTIKNKYDPLAKVAKDCAAGAVLVAAIASVGVGCLILVPRLGALLLGAN